MEKGRVASRNLARDLVRVAMPGCQGWGERPPGQESAGVGAKSGAGDSFGKEAIDSGLHDPDANWVEPQEEKRPSKIIEDHRPAELGHCEALGNEIELIKEAKHAEQVEGNKDHQRRIRPECNDRKPRSVHRRVNRRKAKKHPVHSDVGVGDARTKSCHGPEPGRETGELNGKSRAKQRILKYRTFGRMQPRGSID